MVKYYAYLLKLIIPAGLHQLNRDTYGFFTPIGKKAKSIMTNLHFYAMFSVTQ